MVFMEILVYCARESLIDRPSKYSIIYIFYLRRINGFISLLNLRYYSYVFRVKQIKSELSTQVIKDFRDAFEGPNSKVSPNENFACTGAGK